MIVSMFDSIPDEMKGKEQFVLSFDGKLIRSGLTKDYGDIDMAGTEDSPILQQLKERLQREINVVRDLRLDLLTVDGNPSLNTLEYIRK